MRLRHLTARTAITASAMVVLTTASLTAASGSPATGEPAFTADPLATWQTDGTVWSVASARGVVYVGGTFDSVRPPGAKPGEREVTRRGFAAFDAATGELLPCVRSFTGGQEAVRAILTYRIRRDGKRVASLRRRSAPWDRPSMRHTDSVTPGSRHQYTVEVTDGTRVEARSAPLTVTTAADARRPGQS
ncbi:hypothetical protein [Streptomyces sp. NPDC048521]|uniref:hypothetical protein n=1 Tax=Streptomyces sp. NPDC048521 TaxID=3365566 RepID=UPI00372118CD